MGPDIEQTANLSRYRNGLRGGHYESWFLRANHPKKPRALWLRYTIFSPRDRAAEAEGELWAAYFDADGAPVAAKHDRPLSQCEFGTDAFSVAIDDATLDSKRARGTVGDRHRISWELEYSGSDRPLLLLAADLYDKRFPKAKALASLPMASFSGQIEVDGRVIPIKRWVGSQNHNWGSAHTDEYAWGQVMGFDSHPRSAIELATARLKIGPVWTPRLTPVVLRHDAREHTLNGIGRALRNHGRVRGFEWSFDARDNDVVIEGTIAAPASSFVALPYRNPPGGIKHCLNTKLASCKLSVTDIATGSRDELVTASRAAFEIVGDNTAHGIPVIDVP